MTQLSPLIFQRNFSPKSILLGHIGVLCRKRRPAKNHEDSRHYHWEPWAIAKVSRKGSCEYFLGNTRVSVQGVESLWGDCRIIPADWG